MERIFGKERLYNKEFAKNGNKNIVLWDVLNIRNEQELTLKFISTNSKYIQGIRLAIDVGQGYIEINGVRDKAIYLWEDECHSSVKIKCHSSEGLLSIYNLFDLGRGRGGIMSQADSCGMIVENVDGKIIYHCNDTGFETKFDKLVFQIELS